MSTEKGMKKLKDVISRFYQIAYDAIKRYDRNHLILGSRLAGYHLEDKSEGYNIKTKESYYIAGLDPIQDFIYEAIEKTIDVLTVNYFSM